MRISWLLLLIGPHLLNDLLYISISDSFVDSHELNHTSETNEKDIPDFPEQLVPYFGDAPGEAVCACLQYLFTMLQHSEKRLLIDFD